MILQIKKKSMKSVNMSPIIKEYLHFYDIIGCNGFYENIATAIKWQQRKNNRPHRKSSEKQWQTRKCPPFISQQFFSCSLTLLFEHRFITRLSVQAPTRRSG